MCGRYVVTNPVTKTLKVVKKSIQVNEEDNFNAHPNQKLPVIKKYKNGNTLENLHWGITPKWVKEKNFKSLINARLETIDEKVSFKKLVKQFRCIAIADGYYEWKRENNKKIPHYFSREDKKPLYIAGIFEKDSFCLLTEQADKKIAEIHHRKPVILDQKDFNKYLNLDTPGSNFLKNCKKPELIFHEVSIEVNKPTNNYVSLIQMVN